MHLKKSFWSDNQNEIKIKSFLKKNTNSVFIEFKLDSKNQKLKLGNLQNKIFLDAIFLNKKTKKESHFNLMNRFIFADAVFNFFNHLSFKKQLSKYKLDIKKDQHKLVFLYNNGSI